MWDKLWEAIQKYGGSARDARIGAVGVDQVRDLYKSDKQEDKELAKELNDRYLEANVAGIAGGATAASALTAGIVPTLASEVGGAVGSYAGGEAGSYLDEQFGTQWISPTLSVLGGLGGGIAGYKTLKPSYNYLAKKGVIGYKDVPEDMIALPKGNTRHIGAETYGKTIVTNQPSIIRGGKTSYKFYEQPSTYFKDAKYPVSSKSYNGKEVPAWQLPKGERYNSRTSNPIPITLINRTDSPFIVKNGNFVLENPENARRLSTVHFTHQEPVTPHMGGNWNSKSTTILIPYGNVRKVVQPLEIEPMDTFFPNYNGLSFSTKNSKVLTADKSIYDYYKNAGVDVTFSDELEQLLIEYNKRNNAFRDYAKSINYLPDNKYFELSDSVNEVADKMSSIHKRFAQSNSLKTTFDDMKKLERIEGLKTTIRRDEPLHIWDSPRQSFKYHSAPTTHENISSITPENDIFKQLPKQQQHFIRWAQKHKHDYRTLDNEAN